MSHRTSAEIILDSVTPFGDATRLTSMYVVFPKMILGERNRHRAFSLSDRSSRAVPPEKLIDEVCDDPAMPAKFRRRTTGMGGGEELTRDELLRAHDIWKMGSNRAAVSAEEMLEQGWAKEIVNRPLDPYIRMHSLMTATRDGWLNFFGLRLDAAADPTIQVLAQRCHEAYRASTPKVLQPGEWHLPFIANFHDHAVWAAHQMNGHPSQIFLSWEETAKRWSAARCAHLSYNDLATEKRMTVEKALEIYDRLVTSQPIHASPTEHQAQVDNRVVGGSRYNMTFHLEHPEQSGNFCPGWRQARKMIPGESVAELPEAYR